MRLPYSMRLKLNQAKRLRKSAARAERGIFGEENGMTNDQKHVVAVAVQSIRDEARKAEKEAFCG